MKDGDSKLSRKSFLKGTLAALGAIGIGSKVLAESEPPKVEARPEPKPIAKVKKPKGIPIRVTPLTCDNAGVMTSSAPFMIHAERFEVQAFLKPVWDGDMYVRQERDGRYRFVMACDWHGSLPSLQSEYSYYHLAFEDKRNSLEGVGAKPYDAMVRVSSMTLSSHGLHEFTFDTVQVFG